jgi:hypothetical protein
LECHIPFLFTLTLLNLLFNIKKIMKTFYLTVFCIAFFHVSQYAQESKYFDAPFGGGGGFTPGWYFINLDPVNEKLKAVMPELNSEGIFTTGGGGFIYIGAIRNLRIGGMGFGGAASESAVSPQDGFNREVIYSIWGGGITVEYTLPFIKKVGVSLGALIGGGGIEIEVFRNAGNLHWNNIWTEVNNSSTTGNLHRTLTNSFWIISPAINIDIPFYRFLSFRIGGGYQISLGDNWKIENEIDLSGVPSELNGKSFFINSGIFVGFFSY